MLNMTLLIGRLGTEPELTTTCTGKAMLRFRLAVPRTTRKAADGGTSRDDTQWFTVVAWDQLATARHDMLAKGARVFVAGRTNSRTYTAADGAVRTVWEVTASELELIGYPAQAATVPAELAAEQQDAADDIPF
jgi:single-strand DNA-binding protein